MTAKPTRTVLISGASIAGPSLAYWLHHFGFEVSVVETSSSVRSGGYPIDLRAVAVDVVARMGMLDDLKSAHIRTGRYSFVDGAGRLVGSVDPEATFGSAEGKDLEVPRGMLTDLLYARTRSDTEYIFNNSIATMEEHADGIDVTFRDGTSRRFDLVIGADGLHSKVRSLTFGPESQYHRYLGWCFAGFLAPNHLGLSHEVRAYNTPGKMAAVYAVGDHPSAVHAILCVKRPVPTREEISDLDHQRDLMRTEFSGAGWEIPRMLKDLTDAADDDVFCDTLSQIQMPTWSTGRVALAGDAGYAASFLSGQGTSLAVVGAYILAGELAADSDHRAAFAQYEDRMRGFVTQNQELAIGSTSVLASTNRELWLRNQMFRLLPLLTRLRITNTLGGKVKRAAAAIDIPAYGPGTSGSGI